MSDSKTIKAWLVREKDEFCAAVVFAETRGKARALAQRTEACEDVAFLDIEVRRCRAADKHYRKGKKELDWQVSADRIALVKDCGFQCSPEAYAPEDCPACPAAKWCDLYQGQLVESEGTM